MKKIKNTLVVFSSIVVLIITIPLSTSVFFILAPEKSLSDIENGFGCHEIIDTVNYIKCTDIPYAEVAGKLLTTLFYMGSVMLIFAPYVIAILVISISYLRIRKKSVKN